MNTYTSNNLIRISVAITSALAGNAPVDPTTVTLALEDPSGNVSNLTPTRDGTGLYHADYQPTLEGVHLYSWAGTGAAIVAVNGKFSVVDEPV